MHDPLRSLSIEYLPIDTLVPYARNARAHSKRQIRQIADSIREFGFTNPVLIDRDNSIIAGHGRVSAAKLLGHSKVPTIRLEHLTDAQKRAYILTDNKLAEQAGWDKSILAIEFQHLLSTDTSFDVTITGFDMAEIDFAIQGVTEKDKDDCVKVDDSLPAVTRAGDLWQLGKHRLLCGNALDGDSYEVLLNGERAHLVFSDPPFNVPVLGHVSGKGRVQHREFVMASGEMTDDEYLEFLRRTLRLLCFHSHPGSIHFIVIDWAHARALLNAGDKTYTELKNLCVWTKNNGGMGSLYRSQHELIFVFKNGSAPHQNNVQLGRFGRNRTNVWNYPSPTIFGRSGEEGHLAALHPTVKPVAMVADAILDCSDRGDVVLDAFLGSGTTLIATERVGRIFYGLELDARYCDVAIRRWQQHTGDVAIHAVSRKRFDDLRQRRRCTMADGDKTGDPYEVGYKKPPKRTQFKPGQSGNAKGRPPGEKNGRTIWNEESNAKIPITENGKHKKITKRRASVRQVINKAAMGDLKAAAFAESQMQFHENLASAVPGQETLEREEDRLTMEDIVRRVRALSEPVTEPEPSSDGGTQSQTNPKTNKEGDQS